MQNLWRNNKILLISLVIIAIIIGFIIAFLFNNQFSAIKKDPFSTSKINILVLGYDSSINGPPRADTIMIVSIDQETKEAGILFVPRDTRVNIPGHGKNRINASHAFGGIELTDKTLESFLDISIDYYFETDFNGFASIIDALGGVDIYIEKPLHYVDEAGDLYIDLPAGNVHLDGEKALEYVRYREPIKGDIGRVERQQKFVKAIIDKVLDPEVVVKLPKIIKETKKAVKTNIPYKDISPFVKLAQDMELDNIQTAMVPGEPKYINGASYWLADNEKLKIIIDKLIRSKEYIKNSEYEVSIYNGNGKPGLAGDVGDKLKKYGFKIDSIGNAGHFNYDKTLIKYYKRQNIKTAKGIKELLGGELKLVEEEKADENYIEIILGSDYINQDNEKD